MPLHTIVTAAADGETPITIEAHVGPGLPGFTIVDLPDAQGRSVRDRVRAAVLNSGVDWPRKAITVCIPTMRRGQPYDPGWDLAVALAVLAAAGETGARAWALVPRAELGLDGTAL